MFSYKSFTSQFSGSISSWRYICICEDHFKWLGAKRNFNSVNPLFKLRTWTWLFKTFHRALQYSPISPLLTAFFKNAQLPFSAKTMTWLDRQQIWKEPKPQAQSYGGMNPWPGVLTLTWERCLYPLWHHFWGVHWDTSFSEDIVQRNWRITECFAALAAERGGNPDVHVTVRSPHSY